MTEPICIVFTCRFRPGEFEGADAEKSDVMHGRSRGNSTMLLLISYMPPVFSSEILIIMSTYNEDANINLSSFNIMHYSSGNQNQLFLRERERHSINSHDGFSFMNPRNVVSLKGREVLVSLCQRIRSLIHMQAHGCQVRT